MPFSRKTEKTYRTRTDVDGYVELLRLGSNPIHDAEQTFGNVYSFDLGVAVAFKGKMGSYVGGFRDAEHAADVLRRWYGPNYERYLLGSTVIRARDYILDRDMARVGDAIRPPYEVVTVDGKDFNLVPHNGVDGDYILREVK